VGISGFLKGGIGGVFEDSDEDGVMHANLLPNLNRMLKEPLRREDTRAALRRF
jgi:hypothetical protein